MKRFCLFALWTLSWVSLSAQTYREDGYQYLYDYDHRIVVRDCIYCGEDYQNLWNGDYVRLINGQTYIYRGSSRVLYGEKIWLEHTGDYVVKRNGYQYLYTSNGNYTGVYGSTIFMLWNSVCCVKTSSGYWYLYQRNGNRLGGQYSEQQISVYWNGYYCILSGGYYRILDPQGNRVSSLYSDTEPELTAAGYFQCRRGDYYYTFDTDGNRIY